MLRVVASRFAQVRAAQAMRPAVAAGTVQFFLFSFWHRGARLSRRCGVCVQPVAAPAWQAPPRPYAGCSGGQRPPACCPAAGELRLRVSACPAGCRTSPHTMHYFLKFGETSSLLFKIEAGGLALRGETLPPRTPRRPTLGKGPMHGRGFLLPAWQQGRTFPRFAVGRATKLAGRDHGAWLGREIRC